MRLTEKVHHILQQHLTEGALAIDATAGNGHDTLFLAQQVGASGRVIAIDVQTTAIEATHHKVTTAQLQDRVHFEQENHAAVLATLSKTHHSAVHAIIFNLGYLPGSDKTVQTGAADTQKALAAALPLLCPGGLLCVTAYRGHPGGKEEARAVAAWMHLQAASPHTVDDHPSSPHETAPILWVLQKSARDSKVDDRLG